MDIETTNAIKYFFPNPSLVQVLYEALANALDAGSTEVRFEIEHLDFTAFHGLAKDYLESLTDDSPYAGTVKRLMEGVLHELEFRRELLHIS